MKNVDFAKLRGALYGLAAAVTTAGVTMGYLTDNQSAMLLALVGAVFNVVAVFFVQSGPAPAPVGGDSIAAIDADFESTGVN